MDEGSNVSDDYGGRWKDRYLDIINTLEEKQADAQISLGLMQRYLRRLVQDSSVKNNDVDETLLSLTLDSPDVVRQFLDTVDGYVHLDQPAGAAGGDNQHWLPFVDLLEQQKLSRSLRNELQRFRKDLTQNTDISPWMHFEALLKTYLDHQSGAVGHKGGLWKRLRRASAVETARDNDEHDGELGSDQAQAVELREDIINNRLHIVRHTINGVLYTLVDQIKVPDSFEGRREKLRAELNQVAQWELLPSVLGEITSLVFISNTVHKHEFEAFLQSLNAKLPEIYEFIKQSREIENDAVQIAQALDCDVKESLRGLSAAAQDAGDINALKKSVQERVDNILNAFDRYQISGIGKRGAVFEKLEKLSERLKVLEVDSHKLREVIEKQREDARKDTLTGLPNRQYYQDQADKELARMQRQGYKLTLVVADIDHFKSINDKYGHWAGDRVLTLVSQAMVNRLRASDFIARYGGEEFVILMPETGANDAYFVTDQLREAIEQTKFHYQSETVKITVSFGVTQVLENDALEHAFDRARV